MTNKRHETPDEKAAGYYAAIERLRRLLAIQAELDAMLGPESEPNTPPTPPTAEPAASYSLPTNRMRQQLARFDDLSDADQVDVLKAMGW